MSCKCADLVAYMRLDLFPHSNSRQPGQTVTLLFNVPRRAHSVREEFSRWWCTLYIKILHSAFDFSTITFAFHVRAGTYRILSDRDPGTRSPRFFVFWRCHSWRCHSKGSAFLMNRNMLFVLASFQLIPRIAFACSRCQGAHPASTAKLDHACGSKKMCMLELSSFCALPLQVLFPGENVKTTQAAHWRVSAAWSSSTLGESSLRLIRVA